MNHLIYTLWSHPLSTHITHEDDENWYCGHGTFSKANLTKVDCPEGSRVYSVQIEGYREAVAAQVYINSKKGADPDLYPNHFLKSHNEASLHFDETEIAEMGIIDRNKMTRGIMIVRAIRSVKCLNTRLALEMLAQAAGGVVGYDEANIHVSVVGEDETEAPQRQIQIIDRCPFCGTEEDRGRSACDCEKPNGA
jgi:hypothetical protein